MKELIYCFFIFALLISCKSSTTANQPKLGENFKVKLGETKAIQGEAVSITFSRVLEDSRCPKDVACVWAGNAEIVIQWNNEDIHLNTYLDPKKVTISGYRIKLISLDPYPVFEEPVQEKEYVAELLVTKN